MRKFKTTIDGVSIEDTNEGGDLVSSHFVPSGEIAMRANWLGAMGYVAPDAPAKAAVKKPAAKRKAKRKK